jgi:hypothetical protein
MIEVFFALADPFADQVQEATQGGRFDSRDILMAISIGTAVGVLLFVWAYFRYRKKEGVDNRGTTPGSEPTPTASETGESERRRRRKRRRRREQRPRTPGGLPPPRPEDQLPED